MTTLLVFQLIGEVISYASRLPIPGPVIGMVLLFCYLQLRPGVVAQLKDTALTLLSHLSLLFVPAGVGIVLVIDRVKSEWFAIVVTLLLSTALTIVVSALTVRATSALFEKRARARKRDAP